VPKNRAATRTREFLERTRQGLGACLRASSGVDALRQRRLGTLTFGLLDDQLGVGVSEF
jgi:hypothetical protein